MRKWLAIIVDDQQNSIDHLIRLFKNIEYVDVVATFQDPKRALTYLRVNPVDFIVLDVELGEIDGFEFLTLLPDARIRTILYTAHQQYEDRGYDINLVDVMLKPVSPSRLKGALRRLNKELREALGPDDESSLYHWYDYLWIKGPVKYERKLLWFKNIVYLESLNKKIKIYMVDSKEPLVSNVPFKEILDVLPKKWFKQCHQSYVFNINFFDVHKNNKVKLTLFEKQLPVGEKTVFVDFANFLEI